MKTNSRFAKQETILYVLLTFLISWGSWGALMLLGIPANKNPLSMSIYMLGGLSPTIVALMLPLFQERTERNAHYKRYFNFRIQTRYYLLPILTVVLMVLVPYGVMLVLKAKAAASLNIQPFYMIVPLFFSMMIGGGMEEFGWRGILVHNLQKSNPALSSLGVGLVWAVWHIPLFFLSGVGQYKANYLPFLISIIAYSFVLTPLYLKSGSVIPCILFHALFNGFGELGFHYGSDLFTESMIDSLIKLGISAVFFILYKKRGILSNNISATESVM